MKLQVCCEGYRWMAKLTCTRGGASCRHGEFNSLHNSSPSQEWVLSDVLNLC